MLDGGGIRNGEIPFKFQNMWLKVDEFKDLLRNWWEGYRVQGTHNHFLVIKLKRLKQNLKVRKREIFWIVSTKKLEALLQLGQWDAVEKVRTLTMEELELKRMVTDEFKIRHYWRKFYGGRNQESCG